MRTLQARLTQNSTHQPEDQVVLRVVLVAQAQYVLGEFEHAEYPQREQPAHKHERIHGLVARLCGKTCDGEHTACEDDRNTTGLVALLRRGGCSSVAV